jgi:hypothetical protein
VCDCNYFACMIATRNYLWLQTLTVPVWLKSTWLFGIWLRKLFFVCDCKNCWLFLWLQKKELNQCVIALFCVRAYNQELCVVAKSDCVCVVEKLLGYLVYDYKPE